MQTNRGRPARYAERPRFAVPQMVVGGAPDRPVDPISSRCNPRAIAGWVTFSGGFAEGPSDPWLTPRRGVPPNNRRGWLLGAYPTRLEAVRPTPARTREGAGVSFPSHASVRIAPQRRECLLGHSRRRAAAGHHVARRFVITPRGGSDSCARHGRPTHFACAVNAQLLWRPVQMARRTRSPDQDSPRLRAPASRRKAIKQRGGRGRMRRLRPVPSGSHPRRRAAA